MLLGDRNTSFYHISMLVRRKRNSITVIMSNTGEWVLDEMVVKEVIQNGFFIYTLHPIVSLPLMFQLVLPGKPVSPMKSVILLMEVSQMTRLRWVCGHLKPLKLQSLMAFM